MNKVDKETAKSEYQRWCKAWRMGRKRKSLKGEELENIEAQEEIIIDLIMDGFLVFEDDNSLTYTLEDEYGDTLGFQDLSIKRPKGDVLMECDRYKEQEGMHRAYAMTAAAVGRPLKVITKLEYNTDITNLMAVIGHFLTV